MEMENKTAIKNEFQQNGKRVNTKDRSKGPRYYNNTWNNGVNDRYHNDNRNGGRRRQYRNKAHSNNGSNPGNNYRHNQNKDGVEKHVPKKEEITEDSNKVRIENEYSKAYTKKPAYTHYHHRNSNKPRFAKVLDENHTQGKRNVAPTPPIGVKDSENNPIQEYKRESVKGNKVGSKVERVSAKVTSTAEHGTSPLCNGDSDLINELHDIGKNLKVRIHFGCKFNHKIVALFGDNISMIFTGGIDGCFRKVKEW